MILWAGGSGHVLYLGTDLEYEAAHIGTEGPAMTHSMLAIDWLSLKNTSGGNLELRRSYETNLVGPFCQV